MFNNLLELFRTIVLIFVDTDVIKRHIVSTKYPLVIIMSPLADKIYLLIIVLFCPCDISYQLSRMTKMVQTNTRILNITHFRRNTKFENYFYCCCRHCSCNLEEIYNVFVNYMKMVILDL